MTNYYFPIICIVPLISVDGQASPRLFIAPEIRHEKISYTVKVFLQQRLLVSVNVFACFCSFVFLNFNVVPRLS